MANGEWEKGQSVSEKDIVEEAGTVEPRKRRTDTQAGGMGCCIPWSITSWRVEGPGYIAGYALCPAG
jgi:hypothetical protein